MLLIDCIFGIVKMKAKIIIHWRFRMVETFRKKLKDEGRSLKWFHGKYIKSVLSSYAYFIIQLSDPERMHDAVKSIIEKYVAE